MSKRRVSFTTFADETAGQLRPVVGSSDSSRDHQFDAEAIDEGTVTFS